MAIDPVIVAQRRIEALRSEILELEKFVRMAHVLAGGDSEASVMRTGAIPTPRSLNGSRPAMIAAGLTEILSGEDGTLDLDALLERLADKGLSVSGSTPRKNLGTILWRHRDVFEHIRGVGYRWKGAPAPKG